MMDASRLENIRAALRDYFAMEDSSEAPRVIARLAALCPSLESQFDVASELRAAGFPTVGAQSISTVAQLYYRIGGGGVERVIVDSSELFLRSGLFQPVIITDALPGGDPYPIDEAIAHATVPPIDWGGVAGASVEARLQALRDALLELNVDAIVYHAWCSPGLLFDLLLCRACGVRFILEVHGVFSWLLLYSGPEHCAFGLTPTFAALCDAVVVLTEMNKAFYGHFNDRVFLIPNPVGSGVRRMAERTNDGGYADKEAPARILWVGRFDPNKRPEDALEVLRRVRDAVPGTSLLMVGAGENGEYGQRLQALACELGIRDDVEFAGWQADVQRYYAEGDVFLSTSEAEGFGMTLLEASAAGLPIVMYDIPYIPFAQSEGVVRVQMGDVAAAANAIVVLLSDPSLLRRRAQASSEWFARFADFDFVGLWREVFQAIVEDVPQTQPKDADALIWETLLRHYQVGESRIRDAALLQRDATAEAASEAARAEYEASTSYRLGRALTSVPRRLLRRN